MVVQYIHEPVLHYTQIRVSSVSNSHNGTDSLALYVKSLFVFIWRSQFYTTDGGTMPSQWAFDVNSTSIWHQTLMSKWRHEIGQKWKSYWRQSVDVNLMSRFWPLLMSFWCYFDVMLCWHLMSIQHLFDVKMLLSLQWQCQALLAFDVNSTPCKHSTSMWRQEDVGLQLIQRQSDVIFWLRVKVGLTSGPNVGLTSSSNVGQMLNFGWNKHRKKIWHAWQHIKSVKISAEED